VAEEHEDVAAELRRVRDEARRHGPPADDRAGARNPHPEPSPAPLPPRTPREAEAASERPPDPPDATAVNAAWPAQGRPSSGLSGLLRRLVERLLGPRLQAQREFNSSQVQLDNAMLEYLEKRSAATHRHYDRLLGELGRRLDEADERHVILERELVGHVQDLVHRIDLVLADGSRGRLGLEFTLEEVKERLTRVEEILRRPE
jgi:hypothetical protein